MWRHTNAIRALEWVWAPGQQVDRRRGCDSDSMLVPPAQAHKEPLLSLPPQNPTRLIFINTQLSNIYQTIFNNW